MKILLSNILFLLTTTISAAKIGEWKAYMAYGEITDIEPAGNIVYVLSSNSIFSYNVNDESLTTYDKVYPLSDCTIMRIAWNNDVKRLIIIYDNHNIDLLDNDGNVYNIPDYYNKVMTEDKTVNNIMTDGVYAYLSTNFGIMKVNMRDAEITDTYNIGIPVATCTITQNNIYANTSQGIYACNLSDNLLDPANWTPSQDNVSFANKNDITLSFDNGYTEYIAYDNTNKCYWSNQKDGKLQSYTLNDDNTRNVTRSGINPDGPKYNHFGFIRLKNSILYTVNGLSEQESCIQLKDGNDWIIYNNDFASLLNHRYVGHYSIDVDPMDKNHIIVGGQTGLYEFQNGKNINSFTNDNSPLMTASTVGNNNKDYVIVTSVKFDDEGNLWCLNSISPSTSLFEYTKDGTWISHHKKELMIYENRSLEDMKSMFFDSRNLLWFTNNYIKPAVICYNPETDNIKVFDTFVNQDNNTISTKAIRCVCEDNDGNILVGSDAGLLLLESNQFNSTNPYFTQIKVPRNDGTNLADYLLDGTDISSIAIDGGGRKWIGTDNNGAYLISENYMEQIEHFLPTNSNILSEKIQSIAINDDTGEVFFGTDKGLCSYMSDASMPNENMDKDNVYAYPNPVKPDYTGVITIIGLSYNADVKITTVNGTLVAQGKSNGGMFTWDGNDLKGKRAASGVYMVQTAKSDGSKGTVCKIAVIN